MSVTYINQSIVDSPEEQVILQQVNCQGAMGAGVAKAIAKKYPFVKEQYKEFCKGKDSKSLLGRALQCEQEAETIRKVVCLFGQERCRRPYEVNVCVTDYDALRCALSEVASYYAGCEVTFAIPKYLGCGLAGGDWNVVLDIILSELQAFNVVFYYL